MAHGRYTVVRKLAEGGMAEIFLGRQHGSEGFERLVVLKRIHTAFFADEQFRNMLVDEAHISMGLRHNNIVQVLDLGRAGGRLFLVLELVDGWDLSKVLERAKAVRFALPPGLGLYVLCEVCRALAYAHGRTRPDGQPLGIVHRDVSPQNVLISEQGEVKLADFGIAKALTKRDRTATGVVKGKVAFMSPEQALGQGIDARSDLFSFGTMLYLLAVGVRPFEAATDFEVLARVQRSIYTPPEELRPELPLALSQVVRRLMSVDREQRYQTADELLVDLEGIWRSDFGAPGQTEFKHWLAELGRRDGAPPIGRAPSLPSLTGVQAVPGSGDLAEGQALVLGDESMAESADSRRIGRLAVDDELGALDSDSDIGRLDTIGAASAVSVARESTFITRETAERGTSRGRARKSSVSGMEDTSIHDLSLSLDDDAENGYRETTVRNALARSGSGNRGLGFVIFLVVTLGLAAVAWRLAGRSGTRATAPQPANPAAPSPEAGKTAASVPAQAPAPNPAAVPTRQDGLAAHPTPGARPGHEAARERRGGGLPTSRRQVACPGRHRGGHRLCLSSQSQIRMRRRRPRRLVLRRPRPHR